MTTKKEVELYNPKTAAEKKAVALVADFKKEIATLAEQFSWDDEKLDEMLAHVDEQEVVKGAKTKCTNIRTAITNAHKQAKAPYLGMGKLIDHVKNECLASVKLIEAPLDEAIARRKKKQEDEAKAAQAKKDAETNAELERMRELLRKNGIDPDAEEEQPAEFKEAQVTFTVSEKKHTEALKTMLGLKQFRSLVVDEHGTAYNLEVTVRRSEIDEGV